LGLSSTLGLLMHRDERRRGSGLAGRERARTSCCADGTPAGNADGPATSFTTASSARREQGLDGGYVALLRVPGCCAD
jgi:hypothetical protein